jgi:hypothetical protein
MAAGPSWRWVDGCCRGDFVLSPKRARHPPGTLIDPTQVHKNLPLVLNLSDGDNPRWDRGRARRRTGGRMPTHMSMRRIGGRFGVASTPTGVTQGRLACTAMPRSSDDEEGDELGEPVTIAWSGEPIQTRRVARARGPSPRGPGRFRGPNELAAGLAHDGRAWARAGQGSATRLVSASLCTSAPRQGLRNEGAL